MNMEGGKKRKSFLPTSRAFKQKMAIPPNTPPSNSSAPGLKTHTSSPNPGRRTAAPGAPKSPAAPTSPVSSASSPEVISVHGVIGELRARGYLAGFEIPDAELHEARAAVLFDGVLAAFLAEALVPGATRSLPIPPLLGDGRPVNLLRLYLAVRSRGGFAAVASWTAVSEAVGLDSAAADLVKLVYADYLSPLEQSILKPGNQGEVAGSSGNATHLSSVKKDRLLSPRKVHASAGSAHLKRKRELLVEMLNWVRRAAKSPGESWIIGKNPDHPFSVALMLRHQMFASDGSSYMPCGSASRQGGDTTVEQAQHDGWDILSAGGATNRISHVKIGPCYQADIPEWTGKPSLPYHDPNMLRFLGQPILTPEITEALDAGTIGLGRPVKCNCRLPGSVACVKFHVMEKKIKLKRELGSAFDAMGFHRTGEDAALTWRKDEEKKFNTIIQDNLPSSKYNFWDKLRRMFRSKSRKGLASYYHNVFQLRRRAYQNRVTSAVDSDDDSIEPGFLHLCSASSSGAQRRLLRPTFTTWLLEVVRRLLRPTFTTWLLEVIHNKKALIMQQKTEGCSR